MCVQSFVAAADELPEAEMLDGIRQIMAKYFIGHQIRNVSTQADDVDVALSNMMAELPDEDGLPTYAEILADIDQQSRVMAMLQRRPAA